MFVIFGLVQAKKTSRNILKEKPTIDKYSKKAISIKENTICVTIPFSRINEVSDKVGDKWGDKSLSKSQIKVLAEIRNNPNITIS